MFVTSMDVGVVESTSGPAHNKPMDEDVLIGSSPASPSTSEHHHAHYASPRATPMPLMPHLVVGHALLLEPQDEKQAEKAEAKESSRKTMSMEFRTDPAVPPGSTEHGLNILGGRYLLLDQLEGSHLQRCIDVHTQQEFVCKTVRNDPSGQAMLAAHSRVDGHPHVNPVHHVVVGDKFSYLLFPPCSTDLHSYVRTRRRLREPQARLLFKQIVAAVHEAHSKGLVLRDLKLRKFVFTDESRTTLKLESLEDAVVLETHDDLLSDKHGCPAYVSPEILRTNSQYSGRAADMWGLGVMLYTMLVGRYPFHGQEHTGLFAKIRRGQFSLPDSISSRAKCLIRCLLRKDPGQRLTTEDVLIHPWMTLATPTSAHTHRDTPSNSNLTRSSSRRAGSSSSSSAAASLTLATSSSSSGGGGASSSSAATPPQQLVMTSSVSLSSQSGLESPDQLVPEFFPTDPASLDMDAFK